MSLPTYEREALEGLSRDDLYTHAVKQGFTVAKGITKKQLLDVLAPEDVGVAGNGESRADPARSAEGHSATPTPDLPEIPIPDALVRLQRQAAAGPLGMSARQRAEELREVMDAIAENGRTIQDRLLAVFRDIGVIPKNGTAPGNMGGYAFRRIEDITAALKPQLAKQGLVIIPEVRDRRSSERTTANNKSLWVEDLLIRFRFIDGQGAELTAEMWGQGSDSGDKAIQKAVTSCFKSMLTVLFCITDTLDDAEAHDVPDATAVRAPSQDDLARKAGWDSAEAEKVAHDALAARIQKLHPDDIEKARAMRRDLGWPVRPRAQFMGFSRFVTAAEKANAEADKPFGEPSESTVDAERLAAARAVLAEAEAQVTGKISLQHGAQGETVRSGLLNDVPEEACSTCGGTGPTIVSIQHEPGCPEGETI